MRACRKMKSLKNFSSERGFECSRNCIPVKRSQVQVLSPRLFKTRLGFLEEGRAFCRSRWAISLARRSVARRLERERDEAQRQLAVVEARAAVEERRHDSELRQTFSARFETNSSFASRAYELFNRGYRD